ISSVPSSRLPLSLPNEDYGVLGKNLTPQTSSRREIGAFRDLASLVEARSRSVTSRNTRTGPERNPMLVLNMNCIIVIPVSLRERDLEGLEIVRQDRVWKHELGLPKED